MTYDFSSLKAKIAETEEWLKKEYQGIRTGRATPTLLDSIQIESYGSRLSLKQVGAISVEDARTLRISPWDATQVKAIEKAVTDANLGVGVSADEKGVRVTFPELTSERREALIKLSKDRLEHARVSLRNERDAVWNDIQKKEKNGEMSEDDKFRFKEDMQKMVDAGNEKLDALLKRKEEEIKN
jgi:ribosome recycling factor